jgi:hypothetical protein
MSSLLYLTTKVYELLPSFRKLLSFLATIDHFPTLTEVSPNIALASVIQWDTWLKQSVIFYKTNISCYYVASSWGIPELALTTCEDIADWGCDIQDVRGLAASKAPLEKFSSLDHMAEVRSAQYIHPLSEQNLLNNLSHDEIRILHRADGGGDFFVRYLWDDGRIYLVNSGGSHHFVAARYIAARIGKAVPLRGRLHTYSLNPESVHRLLRAYQIFMVEERKSFDLHERMSACRVEYGRCALPNPFHAFHAIFLPTDKPKSIIVSKMMIGAGAFSLNDYFSKTFVRQPL